MIDCNKNNDMDAKVEVMGGGRIKHDSSSKTIDIYGFSYGFPWPEGVYRHDISAEVIRKHYPGFTVTTRNDGY